ncbi:MAG: T9SS type A sorting domain-containing protein [Ekhidna sp.]|uniref:T9SS type A sorting domain-containing protein n=1 Tax=Ekhidna sp. TaxID=2608089 RepID=UPI0032ECAD33
MRIISLIILLACYQVGYSQLIVKPILKTENHQRARIALTNKLVDPATLPFWDDFSMTRGSSPDSMRIWEGDTASQWNYGLSKDVYVNATLAINPPSYKVATFDGLDSNGAFHVGSDIGLADQLVSDTINLQGKANVFLSFYWQAGGLVEIPEKGDSLVLQFYSPNVPTNDGWETVWLMDGGDLESDQDSVFTQEAIKVKSEFLTQKFVFRFQAWGDKDGPFDAWHVDYIYLNENRQDDDFFYDDQSINASITSPFSPFRSLPVSRFKNDPTLAGPILSGGSNLAPEPDNIGPPANYVLVIREKSVSTIDSVVFTDQGLLDFNPDPFRHSGKKELVFDGYDLSSISNGDSIVITSELFFEDSDDDFLDGSQINLKVNDTIRSEYLLHNYYAFDDGTAEYAAGTNIDGGQIAIKFWLEEQDTLTAIDIHFPNIDPVSNGSPIELRVFSDLNKDPIRTENVTVVNGQGLNAFHRYTLSRQLILPADTFYVGFQQEKNEYIGVGFDRSNPQAASYIYENKTGEWERNERLKGALMIRPVFAKVDSLILGAESVKATIKVYPNPTSGVVRIEGAYESVTLRDFSGKVLMHEGRLASHDLSHLRAGLYLLTIHRREGNQTLKVIKK